MPKFFSRGPTRERPKKLVVAGVGRVALAVGVHAERGADVVGHAPGEEPGDGGVDFLTRLAGKEVGRGIAGNDRGRVEVGVERAEFALVFVVGVGGLQDRIEPAGSALLLGLGDLG